MDGIRKELEAIYERAFQFKSKDSYLDGVEAIFNRYAALQADKAVQDALEELLESTKCHRPECRIEHKVKRADIDKRIAELKGGSDE